MTRLGPISHQAMALGASNLHAAWYGLGVIAEEKGDVREAYRDYNQALALKPGYEGGGPRTDPLQECSKRPLLIVGLAKILPGSQAGRSCASATRRASAATKASSLTASSFSMGWARSSDGE